MHIQDLHIIFHDSKSLFQKEVLPQELYANFLFFSHLEEDTYKPIIQYINGLTHLIPINYSALENTTNIDQKKIYNTLYVLDILKSAINNWIFSIIHLKQPSEFIHSIENLYERIHILNEYAQHFVITNISDITKINLPQNSEKEIIKHIVFFHKTVKSFQIDCQPNLFDITEIDFQKVVSRFLLNTDNYNVIDKHIKCSPKKMFEIVINNLNYLLNFEEFAAHKNYCHHKIGIVSIGFSKIAKQKRFYQSINKNYPTQPFSGIFMEELLIHYRKNYLSHIYEPENAPSFDNYNPSHFDYNITPMLVLAFAPNNHLDLFKAPIKFFIEHNQKFSFEINSLINKYLPRKNTKKLSWEDLTSLTTKDKETLSLLHRLNKLNELLLFEFTTSVNKLLFTHTPLDYNRTLMLLHDNLIFLENYFETYTLSSQEIASCNLSNYYVNLIEAYNQNLLNCFTELNYASKQIYSELSDSIPLLTDKEFDYWKFISIILVEDADTIIPRKYASSNIEEFCTILKESYSRFMDYFNFSEENNLKMMNIESEITKIIVAYCKYYEKNNILQNLFNNNPTNFEHKISKINNDKKSIFIDKNTDILKLLFNKKFK